MSEIEKFTAAPGLTFDALVTGQPGAPLVLLLHGFAESMNCWRAQVAALAAAGYRAVAPGQRGYSPGARPDTDDSANYHIERLMDDAMAVGRLDFSSWPGSSRPSTSFLIERGPRRECPAQGRA
jgi:pimeloyl-ACP methyl ester carboxylesterase